MHLPAPRVTFVLVDHTTKELVLQDLIAPTCLGPSELIALFRQRYPDFAWHQIITFHRNNGTTSRAYVKPSWFLRRPEDPTYSYAHSADCLCPACLSPGL